MIDYYGKPLDHNSVLSEKTVFANRWPLRAYTVRDGSERIVCTDRCQIAGQVEWYAASPLRGKKSSGIASFFILWNPSTGQIEAESSEFIKTDRKPKGPGRIIDAWQIEDGRCRGGSGDNSETWKACERRDLLGKKLEGVGWCYGRPGEAGYQKDWHVCGG